MPECDHYWCYVNATIEGRKAEEVAVVRFCPKCERREVAFAAAWKRATGDYALDEHYASASMQALR